MKNAIIGATMIIVMVLLSLIHMSITTTDVRQNELDKALNSAIRTTMEIAKTKETYPIETEEEFIAEFNKNLLSSISSDSDIEVQVMGVNLEEGMLDVKVISKYKFPTGAEGKVYSRKTLILDEEQKKFDELKYKLNLADGGTEPTTFKFDGNKLVSKVDGVIQVGDALNISAPITADGVYKIEIIMNDEADSFVPGDGNIVLNGASKAESGTWKQDKNKWTYTFKASQSATGAKIFDNGYYIMVNNARNGQPFATMTLQKERAK